MAIAKKLPDPRPPREVAEVLRGALEADPGVREVLTEPLEVAGPGFLNMRLGDAYLEATVAAMASEPDAAVPRAPVSQRVVVDYSSPNVAKEMHVGLPAVWSSSRSVSMPRRAFFPFASRRRRPLRAQATCGPRSSATRSPTASSCGATP